MIDRSSKLGLARKFGFALSASYFSLYVPA
jgi:hypothetical protein